ncbi:MAG: DUF2723 domain-containing protein [Patescibacteria group bacterium]
MRIKITAIIMFLVAAVIYIATAPSSVYTGDSGEITTAVYSWGVAHPTGFPTYIILAKLFSYLLPWIEFAHRLNIFSALSAAATIGVIFLISQKLKINFLAGIVSAAILAFGYTFWMHAGTIQVYTFTALFFSLAIFFLLNFLEAKKKSYFYFLAAICGIGAGTHLTFLLFIPFALLFVFIKDKKALGVKKIIIFFSIALFFAAAIYSYIPLRAAQSPELNWGDPETTGSFISYITQQDYSEKIGTRSLESLGLMMRELGKIFNREITFVGLLLFLFGVVISYKERREWFFSGLSVIFFNILLLANYGNSEDIIILYRYFLPSYIMVAIYISFALQKIFFNKKYAPAVLVFPVVILLLNFNSLNRQNYNLVKNTSNYILSSVPQQSILITSGDTLSGAVMYEQKVLGKRNDLVIIDDRLYTHPWYLESKKKELEAKGFIFKDNLSYLLKENLQKGAYSVSNGISFLKINFDFFPNGIVYKIYFKKESPELQNIRDNNKILWENYDLKFLDERKFDKEFFNKELVGLYTTGLNNLGAYLVNGGFVDEGTEYFKKSLAIRENKNALYNLTGIYSALGQTQKALEYKKQFDLLE